MNRNTPAVVSSTPRYRTRAWERVRVAHRRVSPAFARILREGARPNQIAYQSLMAQYGGEPVGIECRNSNREAWAFVLPEASGDQPWRIQQFDQDSFIGHMCFDTIEEAVEEMLRMGYRRVDVGALDRVAATDRWALGVRRSAIMQRHQEGLISYRQMAEELSSTV
ncbi:MULTISPECIES: hypothetical protein [Pandoraea]|uniref:Uncharacterized protein n=2 Tax=Pandoraea TaxID=93217 RepID=A0A5E4XGN0_9BURK|nr:MULTISPECIES: hypothetical protein [Pandoraea]VVE17514.1 hypothetical protein PCE31107_02973 [Pandoraea cepalis]VVE35328.1 hypothetical protein PTE31013_03894 [Pandoraea terrigena]